jgi:formate dehydrogenase subunit gamma
MADFAPRIPAHGSIHPVDQAVIRARHVEDVVVGEEIIRHRLLSRVIHWAVALFFFLTLLTGLPIWTPIFGWMAHLFGGLAVCRWLHPWVGIFFVAGTAAMFFHWVKEMKLQPNDREWLGPKLWSYLSYTDEDPEVGKYNGGQKLLFFAVALGALGVLLSGIVLWFPLSFPQFLREVSLVLHDVTFILFAVAIIAHIYLGTAAEPGTFESMTRGTVSKRWARLHHPRWYREVTGEQSRRP